MSLAGLVPRVLPDPSTATSQPSGRLVLALHGTLAEPAAFRVLARDCPVPLIAPFYGRRGTAPVDVCAAEISGLIRSLPRQVTRVDVVGHSFGGLVGLAALRDPAARARVHCLVGLGAAWRGTDNGAWYRPEWLIRAIAGESIVELDQPIPEPLCYRDVPVISITSTADRVVPAWSSELGRVIRLDRVRHNELPQRTGEILGALGLY